MSKNNFYVENLMSRIQCTADGSQDWPIIIILYLNPELPSQMRVDLHRLDRSEIIILMIRINTS